jgi:hypothetical protein
MSAWLSGGVQWGWLPGGKRSAAEISEGLNVTAEERLGITHDVSA